MNPKPLASLNHFTVPVFLSLILVLAPCVAVHDPGTLARRPFRLRGRPQKKRSDPLKRLSPALSDRAVGWCSRSLKRVSLKAQRF
jgi:hypothetical protein